MHLGNIEVQILDGGPFGLDGGAMFGVVPKTLWEKKSPPDERNRIRMRANSLLVRAAGKTIVIETGNGTKLDRQAQKHLRYPGRRSAMRPLARSRRHPAEVDMVINTHLHFDHAGGNTHFENGRAVPTFPNARYVVQRRNSITPFRATERDRASYFPENYQPLLDSGQWDLVDGDAEILPGISVERIPGHNEIIQAVKIERRRKDAGLCCRFAPNPSPYSFALDYGLRSVSAADA